MSGDAGGFDVRLIGAAMVRLVGAIPTVQSLLSDPVIIGGLAVMCRLRRAYRVTEDLDTLRLRRADEASGLEVLRNAGAIEVNEVGGMLATTQGPVRVDVLEAGPSDLERTFTDPTDQLEAMAHDWALRTATTSRIAAWTVDLGRAGPTDEPPDAEATALGRTARPSRRDEAEGVGRPGLGEGGD